MNDKTATIAIGKDTFEMPASVLGQILATAQWQFVKNEDGTTNGLHKAYYGERAKVCGAIQEFITKNVE